MCVCVGGGVVVVKSKPLLCVCGGGRVWTFCGICFTHDFLIKIMTIGLLH